MFYLVILFCKHCLYPNAIYKSSLSSALKNLLQEGCVPKKSTEYDEYIYIYMNASQLVSSLARSQLFSLARCLRALDRFSWQQTTQAPGKKLGPPKNTTSRPPVTMWIIKLNHLLAFFFVFLSPSGPMDGPLQSALARALDVGTVGGMAATPQRGTFLGNENPPTSNLS